MKRKAALLLATLLLTALSLTACSSGDAFTPAAPPLEAAKGGAKSAAPVERGVYGDGSVEYTTAESAPSAATRGAKLIKRAELTLQTLAYEEAIAALQALTDRCGGYYESAERYEGGYYETGGARNASYTVRVPKDQYQAFLNAAGDVGHVVSRTENSEDVGEAYYDAELRLKTQRTKQDRLLALLEKADKMEDIISLEAALSEVQYQIEQFTSTLQKYDSLVDFSTVRVTLEEVSKLTDAPGQNDPFGTRLTGAFAQGVSGTGDALAGLALWFARNLILILIVAVLAAVAVPVVRRQLRKREPK